MTTCRWPECDCFSPGGPRVARCYDPYNNKKVPVESWQERQDRLKRDGPPKLPVVDMARARLRCPMCALDLKRIPAYYEYLYPKLNIYGCAMWPDVYHLTNANGYDLSSNPLIRRAEK